MAIQLDDENRKETLAERIRRMRAQQAQGDDSASPPQETVDAAPPSFWDKMKTAVQQQSAAAPAQPAKYDPNKDPELQKELVGQTRQAEMEQKKAAAPAPEAKPSVVKQEKQVEKAKGALAKAVEEVPQDARPDFERRMKQLDDRFETAMVEYKKQKDETKQAQLISTMFNAVTQLMAGAYGMKHGVDLSHIRGVEWDWKGEFDRVLDEMRLKQEDIKEKRGSLEKEMSNYSAEERADKRLQAQETATTARTQQAQAHETGLFTRQQAAQEAAEGRQEKKLTADAYRQQGLLLKDFANKLDKKSYTPEQAKELAAQQGVTGEITSDMKTWFGLGKGEVSRDKLQGILNAKAQEYMQMGRTSSTPAAAGKQDAQVARYAKENNLPYEKAMDILVKRGYKPAQ